MEVFHNEFFFDHVRKKLPRKFRLCCWEGGSEKHTVCPCPEERGKKKVLVTLKNMEWPFSSEKGSGIWQRFLFVWVFTVMGKKKPNYKLCEVVVSCFWAWSFQLAWVNWVQFPELWLKRKSLSPSLRQRANERRDILIQILMQQDTNWS